MILSEVKRKKWFPYRLKNTYKPYKLYCFHHAGGSVSTFRKWLNADPRIEVIPVEIPGRGVRMNESCITDFDSLTDEIAEAIMETDDGRPSVIYGHSLGAILAFEVTYILRKSGMDIRKLIVAGRHAPMDEDPVQYRSSMGMERLKEELLRVGATPKSLIENEDFVSYILPMIFQDYELHEDYLYHEEEVDVPIVALSGTKDVDASSEKMKHWSEVTSSNFSQYVFQGEHFFPYEESERQVLDCLRREVLRCCA